MVAAPLLRAGQRCGPYDIDYGGTSGAVAEAYVAAHKDTREPVILTCSDFSHVEGAAPREAEFLADAAALRDIVAPQGSETLGSGVDDGVFWIAVKRVDGIPLRELPRCGVRPEVPFSFALALIAETGSNLEAAAEQGIFHGDLNPSSVLLDPHRPLVPFVLRLGYAKLFRLDQRAIMSTPRYRAPEQLTRGIIDQRVDIYSLGMMLYELLAGEPPYAEHSDVSVERLRAIVDHGPPRPLAERGAAPFVISRVVQRAIAKDPDERFGTWREFLETLGQLSTFLLLLGARKEVDKSAGLASARPVKPPASSNSKKRMGASAASGGPTTVPPGPTTRRRITGALEDAVATAAAAPVVVPVAAPAAALVAAPAAAPVVAPVVVPVAAPVVAPVAAPVAAPVKEASDTSGAPRSPITLPSSKLPSSELVERAPVIPALPRPSAPSRACTPPPTSRRALTRGALLLGGIGAFAGLSSLALVLGISAFKSPRPAPAIARPALSVALAVFQASEALRPSNQEELPGPRVAKPPPRLTPSLPAPQEPAPLPQPMGTEAQHKEIVDGYLFSTPASTSTPGQQRF